MTTAPTSTTATEGHTGAGRDSALLRLIWLASPALPVGGFSYSEGLEAAVEHGLVKDEASAGDWLVDQLHLALARSDIAVAAAAVHAARANDGAAIEALDRWVLHTRETSELRQQTEQMGRSMGEWMRSLDGSPRTAQTYPVAFGIAAASSGASERDIALAFAFGWAENTMQAAIKSVPLGQSSGQRILLRLANEIPHAVDHALALRDEDRQAFSPMLAILSSRHETQYSRLFRS